MIHYKDTRIISIDKIKLCFFMVIMPWLMSMSAFTYGATEIKSVDPNTVSSQSSSIENIISSTKNRLIVDFNRYLELPEKYQERVKKNCGFFPEGDLFPYIYPALAYVNVALKDPNQLENSRVQSRKLIDLAINSVTRRVAPSGGKLENLSNYKRHGTYLGQLNLALGAYSLISSDDRYSKLNQVLSDLFYNELIKSDARPICSYPKYTWPFDTIPVLVSLHLYDLKTSNDRSKELIDKHLAWVQKNATHSTFGLPFSRVNILTGKGMEYPRGCDLSFRLCLLAYIDQDYTARLYKNYVKYHWIDTGYLAGFSEWPKGVNRFEDVDSGPIIEGIGMGASGMGLGATIACKDRKRQERLCNLMLVSSNLIQATLMINKTFFSSNSQQKTQVPLDKRYYTSFLFGDTMLFYCVSWQQWP